MCHQNRLSTIFLSTLLAVRGSKAIDTATVSITAAAEYAIEPACVQSCVYYNSFDVADYLVVQLGCTSTIYNACYCTQIADQSASTILSSCVNTLCRGTTEISNAISLYESYCSGAGYPRSASASQTSTSTSVTTVSGSTTPSSTAITTTTSTSSFSLSASSLILITPLSSSATSTASSSTASSSSSSASPSSSPSKSSGAAMGMGLGGGKMGVVVGAVVGGLVVGVVTLISAF